MGTLEKLKAYFGMIPADGDLAGYDLPEDDYADDYRRERRGYRAAGPDDDFEYDDPRARSRAARRRADLDELDRPVRRPSRPAARSRQEPEVSGALAIERTPEPVARLRPVEQQSPPARDPLSRIVTLHPSGYAEARDIGEAFRDGNPVIMNLTEMATADAKRLVDFAAGLAFALRGSMDKVTNKVFLLSPSDSDVTAEDRRRIAEGGLFLRQ